MTRIKQAFKFSSSATSATNVISENGEITQVVLVVPNYTNTINTTLTIYDPDGYALYTTGTKTQNATYVLATALASELEDIPVVFGSYATVTLSGITGDSGTDTVTVIYYIKRNRP
jgi:hypothetical protein